MKEKKLRGKRPQKKSKMFQTDLNILLAKYRALSTPIRGER